MMAEILELRVLMTQCGVVKLIDRLAPPASSDR